MTTTTTKTTAKLTSGAFQVQIRKMGAPGEWAGRVLLSRWVPAFAGTLNGTSRSDAWASTYSTRGAAFRALELAARELPAGRMLSRADADYDGYELRVHELTEDEAARVGELEPPAPAPTALEQLEQMITRSDFAQRVRALFYAAERDGNGDFARVCAAALLDVHPSNVACIECAVALTLTRCYACDAPAASVRDRRPEGGRLEHACVRHAETLRWLPRVSK